MPNRLLLPLSRILGSCRADCGRNSIALQSALSLLSGSCQLSVDGQFAIRQRVVGHCIVIRTVVGECVVKHFCFGYGPFQAVCCRALCHLTAIYQPSFVQLPAAVHCRALCCPVGPLWAPRVHRRQLQVGSCRSMPLLCLRRLESIDRSII